MIQMAFQNGSHTFQMMVVPNMMTHKTRSQSCILQVALISSAMKDAAHSSVHLKQEVGEVKERRDQTPGVRG